MKIQKKKIFFFGGGGGRGRGRGGVGGGGGGGQGGCESRIEVFWKIQKKKKIFFGGRSVGPWRGPGWGIRMDVNEELKFL